jgi:O-antigen/teichoic acid export membrane protein
MSESSKEFLSRLFAFSIGPIAASSISFITVLLATWLIVPQEFGKASMFSLVLSLFGLAAYMGLDQAFVREFNAYSHKTKLLLHASLPPLFISCFVSIGVLFFTRPLAFLLFGQPSFLGILCLALCLPLAILERFNMQVLRMQERAKLYSGLSIARQSVYALLMVGFLYALRNFQGILLATTLASLITSFSLTWINRKYWNPAGSGLDRELLKRIFAFGLPLVPANIIGWLFAGMDRLALRAWSDFTQIGLYSTGFKIAGVFLIAQSAFCTFWIPTAYRWYENKELPEKFERVSGTISALMCLAGLFVILSRHLVIRIFDPSYSASAALVPFLIFYPILYTISETTALGIAFSRKTFLTLIITISCAVLNGIGNLILVPLYGALGAAISTAIAYFGFFLLRTAVSRIVWIKMEEQKQMVNIAILSIGAFLSLFEASGFNPFINLCIFGLCGISFYYNLNVFSFLFSLISQAGSKNVFYWKDKLLKKRGKPPL